MLFVVYISGGCISPKMRKANPSEVTHPSANISIFLHFSKENARCS